MHFPICFIIFVCKYANENFYDLFESRLETQCPFTPKCFSISYVAILQLITCGNFAWIQYYLIYIPYSVFFSCPDNILYGYFSFSLGHGLIQVCECFVMSLYCSLNWNTSSAFLCVFFHFDMFDEYRPCTLKNVSNLGLSNVFSRLYLGNSLILGLLTKVMVYLLECIIWRDS